MNIIELLSAFVIGALAPLVTIIIQSWLSNKAEISKRTFQEKKECYVGFLDAIYKSDIENTAETGWNSSGQRKLYLCARNFLKPIQLMIKCTLNDLKYSLI